MLGRFKKLFSGRSQSEEEDGETYFDYNQGQLDQHKEGFGGRFMIEIFVPRLTDKDVTYEVTKWFKKEGEKVSNGEIICQLESKRSVIELDIPNEGYVYFRQKPRKPVKSGDMLCVILSGKLD